MISFDDSLWPLLLVSFEGESSDEEFTYHLQRMDEYLQRQEKYVCIYDATKMKSSPMSHRQLQVEWLQKNDAALRQWMLGTGFVITSPLARLAMTVISTLNKPPCPNTSVATLQQALTWAADRFRDEGHPLPSVRIRTHYGLVHPPTKRATIK
ncbi:hypothetical protein F0U60_19875 [Archangium minus]|uniref:Uncharacterized protein n=1 Tax=Archangium minus TaxID=83450 RepID=A0ABY9WQN9_9BACT|nr:hypothetical protein F0U60_19875 [Archangium minus]